MTQAISKAKLLREIFLLAAELVAEGSEEFSCNAISRAVADIGYPLYAYDLRKVYEGIYRTQTTWGLAWQVEREHYLPEGGKNLDGLREHRIFMLLLARELVRTGDFE